MWHLQIFVANLHNELYLLTLDFIIIRFDVVEFTYEWMFYNLTDLI